MNGRKEQFRNVWVSEKFVNASASPKKSTTGRSNGLHSSPNLPITSVLVKFSAVTFTMSIGQYPLHEKFPINGTCVSETFSRTQSGRQSPKNAPLAFSRIADALCGVETRDKFQTASHAPTWS